jgi:hypothetical protein
VEGRYLRNETVYSSVRRGERTRVESWKQLRSVGGDVVGEQTPVDRQTVTGYFLAAVTA